MLIRQLSKIGERLAFRKMIRGCQQMNKLFRVLYTLNIGIIILGLLIGVINSWIVYQWESLFYILYVMFIYVLGVSFSASFLILNIIGYVKTKSPIFLGMGIFSLLWLSFSVLSWAVFHGPAI